MFTIGKNELDACPDTNSDGTAVCPKCGDIHQILYGHRVLEDGTRVPTRAIGFVKCGDGCYLVAVDGKSIN